MRILKFILIGVAVLIILFFAMGMIMPSVSYGHEIKVDKPVEEAWAISQDETKYAQWLEGFKSMELIEGEKFQPGSKYKVIVEPSEGEEFEMTETIISINEFQDIEMHFDSEFMDFEQKMYFSESNVKTTIKSDSKVIGKNLMMRSMFAIMETLGGAFTAQEKKNMEALKVLIQENSTNYFPSITSEIENKPSKEESE